MILSLNIEEPLEDEFLFNRIQTLSSKGEPITIVGKLPPVKTGGFVGRQALRGGLRTPWH